LPQPSFTDLTYTLLEEDDSPFNEFYSNAYTSRDIERSPEYDRLAITMINPSDVSNNVEYVGYIKGSHSVSPYEVRDGERMTTSEWSLLSALGWSVFTIKFNFPLLPREPRWLRVRGETGLLGINEMLPLERVIKRYLGVLSDNFEIAGPLDVRYRLTTVLKAAGVGKVASSSGIGRMLFQDLYRKLVTQGMNWEGTETLVKDYRLSIFPYEYRRCDDPIWWGDIIPSGPLLNKMRLRSGRLLSSYQWKAGEHIIAKRLQTRDGLFGVRIQAYDDPTFRLFLPWIALVLGIVNLILKLWGSTPKIP